MRRKTHACGRPWLGPSAAALLIGCLAGLPALAGCSGGSSGGAGADHTPDDVVTGAVALGERTALKGTVRAITLKTHRDDGDFVVEGQRYVLLAVGVTEGLTERQAEWGVGAVWPASKLESREWQLPHEGDEIRVTGVAATESCAREQCYTLDSIETFTILRSDVPPLADIGGSCTQDMDCRDDLTCDRTSRRCAAFAEEITWSSHIRDVVGSCASDEDCPIGQYCEQGYTIKGEGPYSAPYLEDFVVGRHLCQVYDRNAPAESVCPRFASVNDVLGGRFAQGKEVCLKGTIWIAAFNPGDRDTHVQYKIPFVLTYPLALPPVDPFGFAAENVPPYKDSENPMGRLGDPLSGQLVAHIGTVHFDDGHGWYELHPVKYLRLLDPATGQTARDAGPEPAPAPEQGFVWPADKSMERRGQAEGKVAGKPGR